MKTAFQRATAQDISTLLPLIRAFYLEHPLDYDEDRLKLGLEKLLTDETLGTVWLVKHAAELSGYIILTFGFSLEFAGRDAFIDEIYIYPKFRYEGLGEKTISFVAGEAEAMGIVALHLEVESNKSQAIHLYEKLGFERRDTNHLMSLPLGS